jgi:hypothetical protein
MRNANLKELTDHGQYPSVSVFMPTHRAHPESQQDPIRLKNLLNEARERLDAEVGKRPSWPIVEKLEQLAETIDWRESQDALALFASEDYATAIRLPFQIEERVTVDHNFETRGIVAAFQRLPHYFVLVLAEQRTRLFAGTGTALEEVRDYGFPVQASGSPGATRRPDAPQMTRSNSREAHIQDFYREVDAALTDALVDEQLPIVVIGASPSIRFFDEVTRHRDRVVGRIEGSHAEANADAIAALAWPQVEEWLGEQREAAVQEVGAANAANLLSAGIEKAWNAAQAGRGARLLAEEGYRQPATIDRETGGLELMSRESEGVGQGHLDDAIDELAELVLSKGGQVVFVADGALADYGHVALMLRY